MHYNEHWYRPWNLSVKTMQTISINKTLSASYEVWTNETNIFGMNFKEWASDHDFLHIGGGMS